MCKILNKVIIINKKIFFSSIIYIFLDSSIASTPCGDWEPFEESHCYKILGHSQIHTYDDAEIMCKENNATLLQIRYHEEQDYVANFLFSENKVVDNVWLGAKYEIGYKQFKW